MLYIIISLIGLYCVTKYVVYKTNARCKSYVCLMGKTALITGGNSGIGLELAKSLACRGCTIIIADKNDASSTVKRMIKETHNPNIFCETVDFASFKSVRKFAEEFKRKYDKLHILVNNAGVGYLPTITEDGLEGTMQVNYFSHFLLTHLLLELLIKSGPSRIIYTSSLAAYKTNLLKKPLVGNEIQPDVQQYMPYANSKTAGAIMSKILSKKLRNTGVTTNVYHPGIIYTNIFNEIYNLPFGLDLIYVNLLKLWTLLFGKNIEEGIQTMLHLTTSDEVENISGEYFAECRPVWQPKPVNNTIICEDIWTLSEEYVKLTPDEKVEGVLKNLSVKKTENDYL
ncbi:retinol dehydrogenase 12-like isoform X1 [Sitophilus oryzae]|uniref:Retinol dehydrogenase 12-like isoform X1 n=1 Tax=Sitophilus oryzae TaxID=7048 RepID=A0A6J2YBZ9_SITOR|nr:retinol dehydrogenase 12-like isoform X1 [Sitophilus oryzae]